LDCNESKPRYSPGNRHFTPDGNRLRWCASGRYRGSGFTTATALIDSTTATQPDVHLGAADAVGTPPSSLPAAVSSCGAPVGLCQQDRRGCSTISAPGPALTGEVAGSGVRRGGDERGSTVDVAGGAGPPQRQRRHPRVVRQLPAAQGLDNGGLDAVGEGLQGVERDRPLAFAASDAVSTVWIW
jgi:hypothetical protein